MLSMTRLWRAASASHAFAGIVAEQDDVGEMGFGCALLIWL